MDADMLTDLKQFIAVTVSQQIAQQTFELKEGITQGIKQLDDKLSQKIDDLSEFVANSVDQSNEATGEQLKNHELRITALEQKAA